MGQGGKDARDQSDGVVDAEERDETKCGGFGSNDESYDEGGMRSKDGFLSGLSRRNESSHAHGSRGTG